MVAQTKIMRWSPWPPIPSKQFEVVVVIHRLQGLDSSRFCAESDDSGSRNRLVVGIKWKGQKTVRLRRPAARNFTKESGGCGGNGVVEWNDEFKRICRFSSYREGLFLPWEVAFTVFNGPKHGSKEEAPVLGTALLNIADLITLNRQEDVQIKVPLLIPGATAESTLSLFVSLRFTAKESSLESQRPVKPLSWSPSSSDFSSEDKTQSSVKAGLRKIKTFKKCMSLRGTKKQDRVDESSSGRDPNRNKDDESNYPIDTDSFEDEAEGESGESRDEKMPYSSWVKGSYDFQTSPADEYVIYYSHRRSTGRSTGETSYESEGSGQSSQETFKKKKLSWRKRKMSFRSPKLRGEPLLKKDCSESGGDDIDFVRRLLCPSDESVSEWHSYKSEGSVSVTKHLSGSEFGEDNFVVGSWDSKEITSRDGSMILKARIFFASFDQRSERAGGENACTALAAVIADWLHNNRHIMPTRSEFDCLIKDGSLEWRNLYENEEYQNRFPDGHFDLETVLLAKIRPVCTVPERSFVGFFHPGETDPEGKEEPSFQFLHGVMSFDSIWEEISNQETTDSPVIYIVSWNDHFFVLLINRDAYYVIDTLGERLYEGCNQAFILKFDKDTVITGSSNGEQNKKYDVCFGGKGSCKIYIKSFLAAIPVRQVKEDLRKGLVSRVHRPLQIEFHYTEPFLGSEVKTQTKQEEEEKAFVNNGGSAAAFMIAA